MSFTALWFSRGLRLALVIGALAAAWHSWTVFSRYSDDRRFWIVEKMTYECGARVEDGLLNQRKNTFGNFNLKGLCVADDFWVSPDELEKVRNNTMKFETAWEPFDGPGTFGAGFLGAAVTILVTILILAAVHLGKWVWGLKP